MLLVQRLMVVVLGLVVVTVLLTVATATRPRAGPPAPPPPPPPSPVPAPPPPPSPAGVASLALCVTGQTGRVDWTRSRLWAHAVRAPLRAGARVLLALVLEEGAAQSYGGFADDAAPFERFGALVADVERRVDALPAAERRRLTLATTRREKAAVGARDVPRSLRRYRAATAVVRMWGAFGDCWSAFEAAGGGAPFELYGRIRDDSFVFSPFVPPYAWARTGADERPIVRVPDCLHYSGVNDRAFFVNSRAAAQLVFNESARAALEPGVLRAKDDNSESALLRLWQHFQLAVHAVCADELPIISKYHVQNGSVCFDALRGDPLAVNSVGTFKPHSPMTRTCAAWSPARQPFKCVPTDAQQFFASRRCELLPDATHSTWLMPCVDQAVRVLNGNATTPTQCDFQKKQAYVSRLAKARLRRVRQGVRMFPRQDQPDLD